MILSRRDGSIIKTSGAIAATDSSNSRHTRHYSRAEIEKESAALESGNAAGLDGIEQKENKPTDAQLMASSIHSFVVAAGQLSQAVQKIEKKAVSELSRDSDTNTTSDASTAQDPEDDTQLLRLRMKKQEIIIFPDPNYLCCVVQDLERNTR